MLDTKADWTIDIDEISISSKRPDFIDDEDEKSIRALSFSKSFDMLQRIFFSSSIISTADAVLLTNATHQNSTQGNRFQLKNIAYLATPMYEKNGNLLQVNHS